MAAEGFPAQLGGGAGEERRLARERRPSGTRACVARAAREGLANSARAALDRPRALGPLRLCLLGVVSRGRTKSARVSQLGDPARLPEGGTLVCDHGAHSVLGNGCEDCELDCGMPTAVRPRYPVARPSFYPFIITQTRGGDAHENCLEAQRQVAYPHIKSNNANTTRRLLTDITLLFNREFRIQPNAGERAAKGWQPSCGARCKRKRRATPNKQP